MFRQKQAGSSVNGYTENKLHHLIRAPAGEPGTSQRGETYNRTRHRLFSLVFIILSEKPLECSGKWFKSGTRTSHAMRRDFKQGRIKLKRWAISGVQSEKKYFFHRLGLETEALSTSLSLPIWQCEICSSGTNSAAFSLNVILKH